MGIIRTENLCFSYKSEENENQIITEVLKNINLDIKKGEFVSILGHNGSGKSTLAKHFNAILHPCSGKVYIDGIDTSDESRLFDIRKRAGMVFQNPDNQIVASVVEEDVAFGPENLGIEPKLNVLMMHLNQWECMNTDFIRRISFQEVRNRELRLQELLQCVLNV